MTINTSELSSDDESQEVNAENTVVDAQTGEIIDFRKVKGE